MNLKGGRETVDAKTSVGRKSISRQKREETENNFNCFRGPPARGWGGGETAWEFLEGRGESVGCMIYAYSYMINQHQSKRP
jgi:hypothetical protein